MVCCLLASCLQHFRDLGLTATSRSVAFLNLLADLGFDLYKCRFSIRLNSGSERSRRGTFPRRKSHNGVAGMVADFPCRDERCILHRAIVDIEKCLKSPLRGCCARVQSVLSADTVYTAKKLLDTGIVFYPLYASTANG